MHSGLSAPAKFSMPNRPGSQLCRPAIEPPFVFTADDDGDADATEEPATGTVTAAAAMAAAGVTESMDARSEQSVSQCFATTSVHFGVPKNKINAYALNHTCSNIVK